MSKPEPFIPSGSGIQKGQKEKLPVPTTHRCGRVPILSPVHGMSGWHGPQLLIYNDMHGKHGWYHLGDYQTLKSLATGAIDFRIMSPDFYGIPRDDSSSMYVRPALPEPQLGVGRMVGRYTPNRRWWEGR